MSDRSGSLSRRDFLRSAAAGAAALGAVSLAGAETAARPAGERKPPSPPVATATAPARMPASAGGKPNILFIMTDQQRFDTIAALGNGAIHTPNMDRLVRRGIAFTSAYSTCPVCVPARYTIRTGCEPHTTRVFSNGGAKPLPDQPPTMEGRCGPYLARVMSGRGYRTFSVGKSHTQPWNEDIGYHVHLRSEELYGTPQQRAADAFAGWIAREHPPFDYIEGLQGERTEMYYMPQCSPLPPELTVEWWAADRAVEQIRKADGPYFGFVSFIGPHPPFAPPVPFNRLYDPDKMPNPVRGERDVDFMDEMLVGMNRAIWADDINDSHARVLKSRYYGEITYIDHCLGRTLDAVEARGDGDNTLICFFADHGDHLGDHGCWQKEGYFEPSAHIPFLVSWPARLPADQRKSDLVCLTDLFAIATGASGEVDVRQGVDVLGTLAGTAQPRQTLVATYGLPGGPSFKVMVRQGTWKYIYMTNGRREQLFNVQADPTEVKNLAGAEAATAKRLRKLGVEYCQANKMADGLDGGDFKGVDHKPAKDHRIYQFDRSRGVTGFPANPKDVIDSFKFKA